MLYDKKQLDQFNKKKSCRGTLLFVLITFIITFVISMSLEGAASTNMNMKSKSVVTELPRKISSQKSFNEKTTSFDFRIPKVKKGRLVAKGFGNHIDLYWNYPEKNKHSSQRSRNPGFNIYRSKFLAGPFEKLNNEPYFLNVYSDYISGSNSQTYYYQIKILEKKKEVDVTSIASAKCKTMTEEELLTSVQLATFRYFWNYGHPVSGLAREIYVEKNKKSDGCTTGGTGFGLLAILVGVEREFITRQAAAARVLKMVTFLEEKAQRYHGAWPHWINGKTGKIIPFSKNDNGADLVETAFMIQGMLTARQFFNKNNHTENEIRKRVSRLWQEVEWDWFLKDKGSKYFYWHWSPEHGFKKTFKIHGYNECMITYLLAIASPTHPISPKCYYKGWADHKDYKNGDRYYRHKLWVGKKEYPLFLYQYSFLGFDPRGKKDKFCNYFKNAKQATLINRAYCEKNPGRYKGYGSNCWGLTSCYTPDGYRGCGPNKKDNGTIAPTAAISSMPFTPKESIEALKHFYYKLGDKIWGSFGFIDAFNISRNWNPRINVAIDQGPIVVMIENYRTGLCWKYFMKNPEIMPMLKKIGWKVESENVSN